MELVKQGKRKPVMLIDFDGTMRPDTGRRFITIIPSVAKKWGISKKDFERIRCETQQSKHFGIWNLVLSLSGKNMSVFDEMCKDIFKEVDYDEVQPNPRLYSQLERMSDKYQLFCSTNNHKIHVDKGCKKMFGRGIDDGLCFKTIDITKTFKDGHFWTKHMPGAMKIITDFIKADPRECTLVDDCEGNLEMARKMDMKTVWITPDFPLSKYLDIVLSE